MLAAFLVALSFANAAPATKTLTEKDNGKTVTIASGQRLDIKLERPGGSGYSWRTTVRPDPKVLKKRAVFVKAPSCPTDVPVCPTGRPEATVFRYDGKSAGRTTLRLGSFGPGSDSQQKDSFRVTVRVR